jgi:hypothetical protein
VGKKVRPSYLADEPCLNNSEPAQCIRHKLYPNSTILSSRQQNEKAA